MRDDRIQYTRHPNLRQHVISRFKNRTNHALPNPDISLATDTRALGALRGRLRRLYRMGQVATEFRTSALWLGCPRKRARARGRIPSHGNSQTSAMRG